MSYDMTVRDNDGSIVQFTYGDDGVDVMETKFLDKFHFMDLNHMCLFKQNDKKILESGAVEIEPIKAAKKDIKRKAKKLLDNDPNLSVVEAKHSVSDPLLSRFHPQRYFGSISEKMESSLQGYLKKQSMHKKISGAKT